MAEHPPSGPLETGADMDYAEHERTYVFFLGLAKYVSLMVVALLFAMTFGFFLGGGFISSIILFALICAIGIFLLR